MAATQECCKQYWTGPWGNTSQSSSCTATNLPSWKLSKLDQPDMQVTAGEAGTISQVMYSYGPFHMGEQKQGDQLKPTCSSTVRIQGVALMTCQKRWTIGKGGEKGPGISVLIAWQDDDFLITVWKWMTEVELSYKSYIVIIGIIQLYANQLIISIRITCVKSSSSSCHAASTDIPDPLSPLLSIVHCLWQVFRATSRILT